ncbi:MAG: S8 family serine peptidase, partial [Candidatus Dormibacteria bacterium]
MSTGGGVLIADVDTGADFSHPDLAGRLIPGAHFYQDSNGNTVQDGNVADDNGHGTMTVGIMVADTNNGVGIASVAPDARALVIKALDRNGSGTTDTVARGIRYAVAYRGSSGERVRVINLSIGSDLPALLSVLGSAAMRDAITYAAQNDVAVAAAAGNTGNGLLSANDYGSIAGVALVVGAVNRDGARAPYSTDGNIFAPGGDSSGGSDPKHEILSTTIGQHYAFAEGTSFSAPHAAGVLAQLIATGYNAADARRRILATPANRAGLPELDAGAAVGGGGPGAGGGSAGPAGKQAGRGTGPGGSPAGRG